MCIWISPFDTSPRISRISISSRPSVTPILVRCSIKLNRVPPKFRLDSLCLPEHNSKIMNASVSLGLSLLSVFSTRVTMFGCGHTLVYSFLTEEFLPALAPLVGKLSGNVRPVASSLGQRTVRRMTAAPYTQLRMLL